MEEKERIERERAAEEALLPKSPAVLRRKLSGMFGASVVANGLRGTFVTRFGGSNKKLQSPPAVSPASAPKSMWASIPGDRCEPVAKGEGEAPVGEPAEAPVGEPAAVSGTSFGTAAVGEHFAGPGWEHDESSEAASKEGGGSDGEWWGEDEGYAEPLEDLEQWLVGALGVDSAAQGPVWVSGVDFGDGAERRMLRRARNLLQQGHRFGHGPRLQQGHRLERLGVWYGPRTETAARYSPVLLYSTI
jgi:hypothetical protein